MLKRNAYSAESGVDDIHLMSAVRSALESSALQALGTRPIANQNRKQQPRERGEDRRIADLVDVQSAANQQQACLVQTPMDGVTQQPRVDITA